MKLSYILLVLIGIFFLCVGICMGQVSVVHFNSEWNADNNFNISLLKDCEIDSIIICNNPDLQELHEIKSVPTIIIFDEGEEIVRFEGNIMMQLEATRKDIQKQIDKILLAKFE